MARRVRDVDSSELLQLQQELQAASRELREIEPEAAAQPTTLIFSEAERAAVSSYLLAKKRDEREGGEQHMTAFRAARQQHRLYRQVVARIPMPGEDDET